MRTRNRWPDHEGHLGRGQSVAERLTPYRPKYDHADIDRLLDQQLGRSFRELTFHFEGALSVDTSDPWPLNHDGGIIAVHGILDVSGSTATEVDVLLDGTVLDTLTIPSTETTASLVLSSSFSAPSKLAMDLVTAGTAAEGLVVVVEYTYYDGQG